MNQLLYFVTKLTTFVWPPLNFTKHPSIGSGGLLSRSQPSLWNETSTPFTAPRGWWKLYPISSCSWSRSRTGDVWNGATKTALDETQYDRMFSASSVAVTFLGGLIQGLGSRMPMCVLAGICISQNNLRLLVVELVNFFVQSYVHGVSYYISLI